MAMSLDEFATDYVLGCELKSDNQEKSLYFYFDNVGDLNVVVMENDNSYKTFKMSLLESAKFSVILNSVVAEMIDMTEGNTDVDAN